MENSAIFNALQAVLEDYNRGNPDPFANAYDTKDVVLIGTAEAEWLEDFAQISAGLRGDCGKFRAEWQLEPLPLGRDALLAVGKVQFVLDSGEIFQARCTMAIRITGEGWKIAHSHLSMAQG
jgi:hypothetical protein